MNTWQMGLSALGVALALTACGGRSNSAANATAVFPIKAGERWSATFSNSGGTYTVGFALDGAPEFDDDGDVYADFQTTNNAQGGFGYVFTDNNTFSASFVTDRSKKQFFACVASNAGAPTRNTTGIIVENGKEIGRVACTMTRQ
jgi:hypothetical protein